MENIVMCPMTTHSRMTYLEILAEFCQGSTITDLRISAGHRH